MTKSIDLPEISPKKDYSIFLNTFISNLKKLKIDGLSLLLYGGMEQKNIIPG